MPNLRTAVEQRIRNIETEGITRIFKLASFGGIGLAVIGCRTASSGAWPAAATRYARSSEPIKAVLAAAQQMGEWLEQGPNVEQPVKGKAELLGSFRCRSPYALGVLRFRIVIRRGQC